MRKIKHYYATELEEAHEMIDELVEALKAIMATMQNRTPWDDAKIILTMAKRTIAKAEGK